LVQPEDLEEIEGLTTRMTAHEPVMGESEDAVERVAEARDPSALPQLRRALVAAIEYEQWAQAYADGISEDYKKHAPGGWMINALPQYGAKYAELLHSAIDQCTPEGEPVRYA
jgi:hypothetical protein